MKNYRTKHILWKQSTLQRQSKLKKFLFEINVRVEYTESKKIVVNT